MTPKYFRHKYTGSITKSIGDNSYCVSKVGIELHDNLEESYYEEHPDFILCTEADYHNALIPLKELIDGELSNAKIYENE